VNRKPYLPIAILGLFGMIFLFFGVLFFIAFRTIRLSLAPLLVGIYLLAWAHNCAKDS
jgi:hypothetical protein